MEINSRIAGYAESNGIKIVMKATEENVVHYVGVKNEGTEEKPSYVFGIICSNGGEKFSFLRRGKGSYADEGAAIMSAAFFYDMSKEYDVSAVEEKLAKIENSSFSAVIDILKKNNMKQMNFENAGQITLQSDNAGEYFGYELTGVTLNDNGSLTVLAKDNFGGEFHVYMEDIPFPAYAALTLLTAAIEYVRQ